MKRRDFVTSVMVGGLATPVIGHQQKSGSGEKQEEGHGHGHGGKDERSTNHTVSFGFWNPTPGPNTPMVPNPLAIDRFAADPSPRALNGHALTPNKVRVRVGDTVSFIISGFHNLLIYGPGTKPEDIDRTKLLLSPPMTFPPLINDPTDRVFRGLDPRSLAPVQDRVEVVGFNTKGRYLVMCGVLPHFFEMPVGQPGEFVMFGYVYVRDDD